MRGYPQVGYRRGGIATGQVGFQDLPAMSAALQGARAAWLLARFGSHIGLAISTAYLLSEGITWYRRQKKTIRELVAEHWSTYHECALSPPQPISEVCVTRNFLTTCAFASLGQCTSAPPLPNSSTLSGIGTWGPSQEFRAVAWRGAAASGEPRYEELSKLRVASVPWVDTETIIRERPWRRPWYVELNGWTVGMPISTAGYVAPFPIGGARPIVIPSPPPPNIREIKIRVNQILAPLRAIIHATSEAADAVDALYNALPPCARNNEFGPQRKLRAVLRYLHKLANDTALSVAESCGQPNTNKRDTRNALNVFMGLALKNLIIEGLIDAAYGMPGSWLAQVSREMGIPFGLQTILRVIRLSQGQAS